MVSNARILHTSRLSLEPLRADDLAALHGHWIQPGVRRYLWDGQIVSEEQVREMIGASDRLFEQLGTGLWCVRPRGDSRLIGCAGYWYFHEPPELELVYSLSEPFWKRGLARECAHALIDHALTELEWPMVQASADTPNEASLELLRRLGMQPAGSRPGAFGTIEVFRIDREEWSSRPGP